LELLSITQQEHRQNGEIIFHLCFNEPVVPSKLAQNLTWKNEKGKTLSFSILQEKRSSELQVRGKIEDSERLYVTLKASLTCETGTLPLGKEITKEFALSSSLTLQRVYTYASATEDSTVSLYFSDSVDAEHARHFLSVVPEVSFRIKENNSALRLVGKWTPGASYTLSLRKGMRSRNGWHLAQDITKTVVLPDLMPLVRLAHPGQILSLQGNKILTLETVNCASVELALYRVYSNNLVHFLRHGAQSYHVHEFGRPLLQRQISLPDRKNVLLTTPLNLKELLAPKPAIGPYFVTIAENNETSDDMERGDARFLLLTDLGITVKQEENGRFFCWITSFSQGRGVEGAKVTLQSKQNQEIAHAITSSLGIALLPCPKNGDDDPEPFIIQANKGEDLAILRLNKGLWNLSRFATSGNPTLSQGYKAFLYSDRGVYRPGETIHLVSVVRDMHRRAIPCFPLISVIKRPDNVQSHSTLVTPDKNGVAEISW
jgi:uncharacterized protein YfaS (alpha-2-macroglobulin family)